MRWFQRVIAAAVPSASAVTAAVGASYGQDHVVRAVSADMCRTPADPSPFQSCNDKRGY